MYVILFTATLVVHLAKRQIRHALLNLTFAFMRLAGIFARLHKARVASTLS